MAIKLFRLDDLRTLAEHTQWPSISLYLPTHRAGRQDMRENPIRLRNAVGRARERIEEAGYSKERAAEMFEQANDLIASREFWLHQTGGLALFIAPGFLRHYRVPLALQDDVVVGDHFSVKQLIPLFTEDGRFYILALSQKKIRFFEATRTGIQERAVPDMPRSIDDLRQYDVVEEHIQSHTTARTPQPAGCSVMFHGHGNIADKARYKDDVHRYVTVVSRKLEKYLDAEKTPLILAAVEYEQAFYRQVNSYHHLLENGIVGNPDGLNEDEIHQAAWGIVRSRFAEPRRESLTHYADLSGKGKTSDNIEEILPAACHGRVRTLYLRTDVPVWGRFDGDELHVETHVSHRQGDTDLLGLATIHVLRNKGMLYALREEDMPTDRPQAAMFRY